MLLVRSFERSSKVFKLPMAVSSEMKQNFLKQMKESPSSEDNKEENYVISEKL